MFWAQNPKTTNKPPIHDKRQWQGKARDSLLIFPLNIYVVYLCMEIWRFVCFVGSLIIGQCEYRNATQTGIGWRYSKCSSIGAITSATVFEWKQTGHTHTHAHSTVWKRTYSTAVSSAASAWIWYVQVHKCLFVCECVCLKQNRNHQCHKTKNNSLHVKYIYPPKNVSYACHPKMGMCVCQNIFTFGQLNINFLCSVCSILFPLFLHFEAKFMQSLLFTHFVLMGKFLPNTQTLHRMLADMKNWAFCQCITIDLMRSGQIKEKLSSIKPWITLQLPHLDSLH